MPQIWTVEEVFLDNKRFFLNDDTGKWEADSTKDADQKYVEWLNKTFPEGVVKNAEL